MHLTINEKLVFKTLITFAIELATGEITQSHLAKMLTAQQSNPLRALTLSDKDGNSCWLVGKQDKTRAFKQFRSSAGARSGSQTIKYEHLVPMNVILYHLVEAAKTGQLTPELFKKIAYCGEVVMVTAEESDRINSINGRSTMPIGWKPGDDPTLRLEGTKICLD